MSKIQRITQKIFGSNAPSDDIAALGSFKTGTPVYTDDISILQNAAYEEGYGATLVANEAPFMEEQNSVPYVLSKQLAYLFQEGVSEYDAGTTYFIGSIVKGLNENNIPILYYSLTDNNTGNALTDTANWGMLEFGGSGGGLEVGDIGIALYVDETKGLRRYLNGSKLSITSNTQGFLTKLKAAAATYPSLLAESQAAWDAIKTASVEGQCGKFFINEEEGYIQLPCVVKVQGCLALTNISEIVDQALPNVTGSWIGRCLSDGGSNVEASGALTKTDQNYQTAQSYNSTTTGGIGLDLSEGNAIYQDDANVQEEAIQYPYFIQIATGVSEEVDITNEYQLNNPFFFGMSIFSTVKAENASWLLSNGQYNAKSLYPDYYNWILENVNNNVAGFKLSTATDITDYDFVLNAENETFRLPITSDKRTLIDKKEPTDDDPTWYNLYSDGWLEQGGNQAVNKSYGEYKVDKTTISLPKSYSNTQYTVTMSYDGNVTFTSSVQELTVSSFVASAKNWTNSSATVTTYFWQSSGYATITPEDYKLHDLYLYFYVGETLENLDKINVGAILEAMAEKVSKTQAVNACMPSYENMTSRPAGTYTETVNGVLICNVTVSETSGALGSWVVTIAGKRLTFGQGSSGTDFIHPTNGYFSIPKNTQYTLEINGNIEILFAPLKGEINA